jgi:hypothetical protein
MSRHTVGVLAGAALLALLVAPPAARADQGDAERREAEIRALQKELAALQDLVKMLRDREREAQLRAKLAQEQERQRAEEAEKQKRDLELLRDLAKAREADAARAAAALAEARDQAARLAAQAQAQEERARKLEAVAREEADKARAEAAARARLAEEQARAADRGDREAAQKFLRGVAESFLDAALVTDVTVSAQLAKDYRSAIEAEHRAVASWLRDLCPTRQYQAFKVEEGLVAPSGDEAVFRGLLVGPEKKAHFSLRVAKDKEAGRYFVIAFSVRPE